ARVRTPQTDPGQREKLTAALMEAGGQVMSEPDGALRVTGLPLPRISDLAHDADVRLWELSPHQASLEEAYMRLTQGAVDYRSTDDRLAHLQPPQQPGHHGYGMPPQPVVQDVPQQGWYAPPPPGQNPYAGAPGQAPAPGPYAPPAAPQQAAPQPSDTTKDAR
ncbi:ABC transporter ATP-binding protein, partial [Streptomyces massasporeus]